MVSLSQRNGFAELPEGCIANILSWTTPKDAGRACAVYPLFRAAAESDTVWKRMLPSDWQAIIARSVTPLNFPSLKHLYPSLSEHFLGQIEWQEMLPSLCQGAEHYMG